MGIAFKRTVLIAVCILVLGLVLSMMAVKYIKQRNADKKELAVTRTFPVRGLHLDLRIQVMTMDALKKTAKMPRIWA